MNIMTKLPAVKPELMSGTALMPLRVVDAHSLPHRKTSKAARAVIAADILDGLMILQNPTVAIVAAALGVSASSVANARRLTPEQRDAVRKGRRPLILATKPAPLPLPLPASISVREQLAEIVAKVGVNTMIDMIAELDCSAAA